MKQPVYVIDNIESIHPIETKQLGKLYFEKDAYEGILSYLINNSFMDTPEYQKIWLEYIEKCISYNEYNVFYYKNIVINLIPEEYKNCDLYWVLDYVQGELKFYD